MDNKLIGNENNIIFYTDEEGNANIEVILQNEDVRSEEHTSELQSPS